MYPYTDDRALHDTSFYINFAALPVRPISTPGENFVDWEMLFEHPETGFLSCVLDAQSPQTLRRAVNGIISGLYLRRNDAAEKAYLSNKFDRMIGDHMDNNQLQIVVGSILTRLRKIKEYRKARQMCMDRT